MILRLAKATCKRVLNSALAERCAGPRAERFSPRASTVRDAVYGDADEVIVGGQRELRHRASTVAERGLDRSRVGRGFGEEARLRGATGNANVRAGQGSVSKAFNRQGCRRCREHATMGDRTRAAGGDWVVERRRKQKREAGHRAQAVVVPRSQHRSAAKHRPQVLSDGSDCLIGGGRAPIPWPCDQRGFDARRRDFHHFMQDGLS